jgi:hypothetical protein
VPTAHGEIRLRGVRSPVRRVALGATLLALLWLGYRLVVLQPVNQRDWEYGMDVLAHVTIDGDVVQVQHVRDFHWPAEGPPSSDSVDRTFDVRHLERVWFVKEPFSMPLLQGFEGVAHTYFVFDFQDQPPVAISVESRRERGEGYDALRGLINEYELIYIWGTERDLTGRRAVVERSQLYMYPLVGSMDSARRLFLNLAEESRQLETRPRFYNTFTSNCTNELAKAANQAQPGAIPPHAALIFPGYSDGFLYELGFIPNAAPLETVRQQYAVTDAVAALIDQPNFSGLLRLQLNVPHEDLPGSD